MFELTKYCTSCPKIAKDICTVYENPSIMMRWVEDRNYKIGCNLNVDNIITEVEKKDAAKKRIGQQKSKKKTKK